ncbi:V-type proton ATPase subunit H-like [Lytechinus variegatus]|uniref:V-type proton ATPase subunit H-like n=1 Tax=Lytechinus variegatus TaxID=7654 RepID=UPI001BB2B7A8|nr:V-type proton ATPase subunit H-like [Lytechinus variegatus]XP_041470838.1 V-type proton ATPase subunit H-like [Lytechinus variegatus]
MPEKMTNLYTQLSPDGPQAGSGLVGGHADLPPLNLFEREANEVRNHRVNWQSYLQGQMISQEDFAFIKDYDLAGPERRDQLIQALGPLCAKTLVRLMGRIAKEMTVRYILTLVDDMLKEKPERVSVFAEQGRKSKTSPWVPFLTLLNREDQFATTQSCRIVAKLATYGKDRMNSSDLKFFFNWIRNQLTTQNNEYIQTVAMCLQQMLKYNEYRVGFMANDGISTLILVLSGKVSFQIQYQLIFCIWMVSFNSSLCAQINKYKIVPVLADILSESVKEKVTRIILAVFRNLVEKPEEKEVTQENALSMIQCKVLKQLEVLEGQKIEDPDITEDIEYLNENLHNSMQDLSSFDEYSTEVKSGRLEWSPVHKSEKFWRENAARLNEKNYELLKILTRLLESSKDPLILCVSAHDIGEYVRHYPRGKNVIEQLGGKHLVMQYMTHEDPNVRYEALLAVQKLMVHNWEYLGRQLVQQEAS